MKWGTNSTVTRTSDWGRTMPAEGLTENSFMLRNDLLVFKGQMLSNRESQLVILVEGNRLSDL